MRKLDVTKKDSNGLYSVSDEKNRIIEFLSAKGLTTDNSFIDQISEGDIIEIYSVPENMQIYQNQEFLKLCSYSPEQMTTIPFPKLFWRSDETNIAIMRRAAAVIVGETKCVRWDVSNHELVESLHPRKRTFEMSMGNIAPCFDIATKKARAWASSLKVNLIFEWQESV